MYMRVRNMTNEHQSTYQKLYSYKKKKAKASFFPGILALMIGLAALLFHPVLSCVFSLISLIISGGETVARSLRMMKKRKFDDGVFVLLAVLITFFLGSFAVAAIAMAIYKIAGAMIIYLSGEVGVQMKELAEVLPDYANLIDVDGSIREVETASLMSGMRVMIRNGDVVPADCIIQDGFSDFDTNKVYASGHAVSLSTGEKVLAGFVNTGTTVTCEVLHDYDASLSSDMRRIASVAEKSGTKSEKRFLSIAKLYPPTVILLAVLILVIGGFVSGAWGSTMQRAAVLLVVASTGSYLMATPILRAAAIWNLKKKGLSITSCNMLDDIAYINCVAFEKNGILTDGVYTMEEVYAAEGITKEDLLMFAGNCLGGRPHPVSQLLRSYMDPYVKVENVLEFPERGIECTIMGKTVLCGSETFITSCGVDIEEIKDYTVYVAIDQIFVGAIRMLDPVKYGSERQLDRLRDAGVEKIVMLTSERKELAEQSFVGSGADDFFSDLTSYDRVKIIKRLKRRATVTCAYIGDLLNGSQAMETADVGIVMVNSQNSSVEYSKAAMMGDLNTLTEAIETSRIACGKFELHFYCATAVKIILILLALFGAANVAIAVLIDAMLSCFGLLSASDMLKK